MNKFKHLRIYLLVISLLVMPHFSYAQFSAENIEFENDFSQLNSWHSYDINFLEILKKNKPVSADIQINSVDYFEIKTQDLSIDNLSFYHSDNSSSQIMDGEAAWIPSFNYLTQDPINENDIASQFDASTQSKVINFLARGSDKQFTFRPNYSTLGAIGIKFDLKTSHAVVGIDLKVSASDGNRYRFLLTNRRETSVSGNNINAPFSASKRYTGYAGETGDNFCLTWGADGNQYASMDDGIGWDLNQTYSHSNMMKIQGDFGEYSLNHLAPTAATGYPSAPQTGYYAYGIYSVDDVIYQFLSNTSDNSGWSNGPFQGANLIYTPNYGETFYRWDGVDVSNTTLSRDANTQILRQEQPRTVHGKEAYAFSTISFAQMGQNNSQAIDNFVYMYSPDGPYPHQLNLARVAKDKITDKAFYEYFTSTNPDGSANWTSDMANRGVVHSFPEKTGNDYFGWYSWQPSVVWNEPLGLFVMATGGTYAGHGLTQSEEDFYDNFMHEKTGSLGIYTSEKPWGPWQEVFYDPYWKPDGNNSKIYQPKLSPKWISADGKEMVLIWSDHSFYTWHEWKFKISGTATSPDIVANFTANSTSLEASNSVVFSDASSNNPTSWNWTFAGGTPATSTEQNPVVTYNTAGTYAVTLQASNLNGANTKTEESYITVNETPVNDDVMNGDLSWISSFSYLWNGAIDSNDIESIYDQDQGSNVIKLFARNEDRFFTFKPPYNTSGVNAVSFDTKTTQDIKRIEIKINASDNNWYRFLFKTNYQRLRISGHYIYAPLDTFITGQWEHHEIRFLEMLRELTGDNAIEVNSIQRFVIRTQDVLIDNLVFKHLDQVADTIAPQITLNGSSHINLSVGDIYTDAGATAIDNIDGDITNNILTTGSVDTSSASTYTLVYTVADSVGNQAASVSRTITVVANGSTIMNGESHWIPSFEYLWSGQINPNDIESVLDIERDSHVINLFARGQNRFFAFKPSYVTAGVNSLRFDAKTTQEVKRVEIKINASDGNWYRFLFKSRYKNLKLNGRYIYAPLDLFIINQWGHHEINFLQMLRELSGNDTLQVESVQRFVINTQDLSIDNLSFYDNQSIHDIDTDQDGIPDITDLDDDNDGITDLEEIIAGSDPLDPNSVPDNAGNIHHYLVGHWKLDEAAGSSVFDSSGNNHVGVLNNPPTWGAGHLAGAITLDGATDISFSTDPQLQPDSLTVSAWVKVDPSQQDWGWIAGEGDNFGIMFDPKLDQKKLYFYYYNGTSWSNIQVSNVDLADGQWHHVAASFDRTSGLSKLYVDTQRVANGRAGGAIVYANGSGFRIGSMKGTRLFKGSIDDVRLYNKALSQEIITTISTGVIHNASPVADNQEISIGEDTRKNIITLTASDGDNDPLTYALVGTSPEHGKLSGIPPYLTYTPDSYYSGTDSFTFKVNDGVSDSAVANVNIIVNQAPPQLLKQIPTVSLNPLKRSRFTTPLHTITEFDMADYKVGVEVDRDLLDIATNAYVQAQGITLKSRNNMPDGVSYAKIRLQTGVNAPTNQLLSFDLSQYRDGTVRWFLRVSYPGGQEKTHVESRKTLTEDGAIPFLVVKGENPVKISKGFPYVDAGAVAYHSYAKKLKVTTTGAIDVEQLGIQTISYSTTDGTQTVTKTRQVEVIDSANQEVIRPDLSIDFKKTNNIGTGINQAEWTVAGTSSVDGPLTIDIGGIAANVDVINGVWQTRLDVTALSEGIHELHITQNNQFKSRTINTTIVKSVTKILFTEDFTDPSHIAGFLASDNLASTIDNNRGRALKIDFGPYSEKEVHIDQFIPVPDDHANNLYGLTSDAYVTFPDGDETFYYSAIFDLYDQNEVFLERKVIDKRLFWVNQITRPEIWTQDAFKTSAGVSAAKFKVILHFYDAANQSIEINNVSITKIDYSERRLEDSFDHFLPYKIADTKAKLDLSNEKRYTKQMYFDQKLMMDYVLYAGQRGNKNMLRKLRDHAFLAFDYLDKPNGGWANTERLHTGQYMTYLTRVLSECADNDVDTSGMTQNHINLVMNHINEWSEVKLVQRIMFDTDLHLVTMMVQMQHYLDKKGITNPYKNHWQRWVKNYMEILSAKWTFEGVHGDVNTFTIDKEGWRESNWDFRYDDYSYTAYGKEVSREQMFNADGTAKLPKLAPTTAAMDVSHVARLNKFMSAIVKYGSALDIEMDAHILKGWVKHASHNLSAQDQSGERIFAMFVDGFNGGWYRVNYKNQANVGYHPTQRNDLFVLSFADTGDKKLKQDILQWVNQHAESLECPEDEPRCFYEERDTGRILSGILLMHNQY